MEQPPAPQGGQQGPAISGQVLFYQQPEPLAPEQHGALGVRQIPQPFEFLRMAHAVPITVTEFGMAAGAYPLIFVGEDRAPVAVMGVRQGQNLFVTDEGLTDAGLKVRTMRLPDIFIDQDSPDKQYALAKLDADAIVEKVLSALKHNSTGVEADNAEEARA